METRFIGIAGHSGAPPTCNSLAHNGSKSLKDEWLGGLKERETYNMMGTLWPSTSRRLLLPDSMKGSPALPAYLSGGHLSPMSGKQIYCQVVGRSASPLSKIMAMRQVDYGTEVASMM